MRNKVLELHDAAIEAVKGDRKDEAAQNLALLGMTAETAGLHEVGLYYMTMAGGLLGGAPKEGVLEGLTRGRVILLEFFGGKEEEKEEEVKAGETGEHGDPR